jgi:NADH:ubiquinone oxidoreductase subunit 6 (subunit J)
MLSRKVMTRNEPLLNRQWGLGLATAAIFFFVMLAVPLNVKWPLSDEVSSGNELVQLGLAFLGSYVIPFEVVSILLLVALIGAIILARDTSDVEVE